MKKLLFLLLTINCSLPTATAQWVQVSNGMGNRSVDALAYSGNNLFAGAENNYGIYRTTNSGTSWIQTSLNNRNVRSLVINGNNIFAGTVGYGVYLSTNNGTSWTQTSLNDQVVYSLTVNGNNVFAGTAVSGIFLSTNNGTTWSQTSFNIQEVPSLAVNGNNVFAGTSFNGIYKSTDNGTTWTQTSLNNHGVSSLVVNGNYIFAGTYNPANGVFLSTNNGTTWSQTSSTGWIFSLAVNGNNVFAGTFGGGVFVSNDNGASWTQRNEGLGNDRVRALCIANNYIFAGTLHDSSVYRRPLTELVGIQPISEQIPVHYALEQNYPNPFNPTTKIRFAISQNSVGQTFLSVYDALGREVAVLVNEQLKPGTYEVEWNASNYPSGIYFYTLSTEEFSQTRKAALIK